jgi:osmoprotectant transport system ATP-binding protein
MSIIKFEHAKKSYGDNVIIPDFNLEIDKGEFVTLIGTSGCGKTTLLKMINGLNSLDSGTIYVEGKDIQKENLIELRRNIGYAIQGSGLFPHMSVKDNIAYVPNLLNKRNKAKTKAAVEKWIHVVGLDQDLLDRYPDELSGGQQQRVGIARSLAASPDILLMDEPFGAVDEITRHQLQGEIKRIHEETNVTILFVTHDIQEALKLGTKILVLEHGEIAQYGTAEEIQAKPANAYVEKLVHGE